jgi:hypothetical protein
MVATARVEDYVERLVLERNDAPTVVFIDLPDPLSELAIADLADSISGLPGRDWLNDDRCRQIAQRLAKVAWIAEVNFVRCTAGARFEVSGRYRLPVAMVQQEGDFMLVDNKGVRLPGTYQSQPMWMLIEGVGRPAPQPGATWEGEDLQAALAIVDALEREAFGDQITAVLVGNAGGRLDPRRSHIELGTDRNGGRIRWGSAPGSELEENTFRQKLAILRANFRDTGRADAQHPVIDVSTFPDRFTIPG